MLRVFHKCFLIPARFASKQKLVTKLEARVRRRANCTVYGCGLSASGALAIPSLVVSDKAVTSKETRKPKRIAYCNLRDIKKVSSGFGFSLFASKENVYGSGLNNNCQITCHSKEESTGADYYIGGKRIALPGDPKVIDIAAGRAHSVIATSSGVFAFGSNVHGQCGVDPVEQDVVIGRGDEQLRPIRIASDSPVVKVHCTLDTTFLLTELGEVFAFGLNEDGQCANGKYGIQWEAEKIIGDADGERIVDISGSTDTVVGVSDKGDVFVWGQNEYGQAGEGERQIQLSISRCLPLSIGRVVSASSTASSCIAVNSDGIVHTWGVGFLGLGPSVTRLARPTPMDQPLFNGKKVNRVFGGNTCMAAVNEEGNLFVWGANRFGQLGLGTDKDQHFPLQVYLAEEVREVALGTDHTLIVTK